MPRRKKPPAILPEVSDPHGRESRAKAAAITGVSPRYVSDAKALKAAAPEDFDAVKRGEMTLPQAKKKNAKPKPSREEKPQPIAAQAAVPQSTATIPEPPRRGSEPVQSSLLTTARAAIARWAREATEDEWRQIVKALDDADTRRASHAE